MSSAKGKRSRTYCNCYENYFIYGPYITVERVIKVAITVYVYCLTLDVPEIVLEIIGANNLNEADGLIY